MISDPTSTGETMDDPSSQTPPSTDDSGGPETGTLPIDFCGPKPPSEGQVIKVRVVSVDSDNGSFDVVCVPNMQPAARGIKAAVASLGQ